MSRNYTDVLLEEMNSKFDYLIEVNVGMQGKMDRLARQEDLEEVKQDVKVIRAAVTDTSQQVADHERRITKLES